MNGSNAPQDISRSRRPPTVDEALPYTPFTSIVPFPAEVISPPEANPSGHFFSSIPSQHGPYARQILESLDRDAAVAVQHGATPRLSQTLANVRNLLSGNLPQFDFKTPAPSSRPNNQNVHSSQHSNGTSNRTSYTQLSHFANMVLDDVGLRYRYPTPISPEQRPVQNGHSKPTPPPDMGRAVIRIDSSKIPARKPLPDCQVSGHQPSSRTPHQQPSQVSYPAASASGQMMPVVSIPSSSNPRTIYTSQSPAPRAQYIPNSQSSAGSIDSRSPSASQNVKSPELRVAISRFPPLSDPSQFKAKPETEIAILRESRAEEAASKKRKRTPEDDNIEIDHREQTDAAVSNLQNVLHQVFAAEDQLEPDTSGAVSSVARSFFFEVSIREGRQPALSSSQITTIEEMVNRVRKAGRIAFISVDHLGHLQKLCLSSLSLGMDASLVIPSDISNDTAMEWSHQLDVCDNSLRASRLLLQIMNSGLSDSKLYSENMVHELLQNLQQILETCIIPLAERRGASSDTEIFQILPESQTQVVSLMQRAGRVLKLVGDLALNIDLSETSVTTIQFLSQRLVFLENATKETESVLGVQKVEALRRHAMDVTANIFRGYAGQRRFIIDDILTSLEKLPVTRQSARQFKIANAKPIQLVSALVMQLIQISTVPARIEESHDNESNSNSEANDDSDSSANIRPPKMRKRARRAVRTGLLSNPLHHLTEISKKLTNVAQDNAVYVVGYLVKRAMTSTKAGDQPYRNLLDIFTEDFLNVFGSPIWPGAELLLRALLSHLLGILKDDKNTAPAKNMALELLGSIGSTIAEIRTSVARTINNSEGGEMHNAKLVRLLEEALDGKTSDTALVDLEGPYRFLLEHFQRHLTNDMHIQSATHYVLASWSQRLANATTLLEEDDASYAFVDKISRWLVLSLEDPGNASSNRITDDVSNSDARLYHAVIILNSQVCKAFETILNTLLATFSSPQSTIRSRSVKSLTQLLEQDPSILDRSHTVMNRIMKCTTDNSPLVRDSALGLLARCTVLRPSLEGRASACFIDRTTDAAKGVRKKALNLLKDVYLRNQSLQVKAEIVGAILGRLSDVEENIADLARQNIEDIWLSPFHHGSLSDESRPRLKRELEQHACLVVKTAQGDDTVVDLLTRLFKDALNASYKSSSANRKVCKSLVETLFDWIIDNDISTGRPVQRDCLHTLTIFARAEPNIFTSDQMITLRPYIENLATRDDIFVYRSVVMIYRRVLPVLPPLQRNFLLQVQDVLLKTVQKLGKIELNEVTMCLWHIDSVLMNTERLSKLINSVLRGILQLAGKDLTFGPDSLRLPKYMSLAGYFGKACNLDSQMGFFKQNFPNHRFESVSELIIDTLLPYTNETLPLAIREGALEAICLVSESWPKGYRKQQVASVLMAALEQNEPRLKFIIFCGIRDFYASEEEKARPNIEADAKEDKQPLNSTERLQKSMVTSDTDGAATGITNQFLPYFLKTAVATADDLALVATEIIASIDRQGLVHPREIASTLVCLEICPLTGVAKIALEEHLDIHSKHESMLDKEYQNALEHAFIYTRDIVRNITGINEDMSPKLGPFYEVLKTGSIASRKKLLTGLCTRLDNDISKVANGQDIEHHLQFARFLLNNIGLWEYGRIDELLTLITGMENVFATSGNVISQQLDPFMSVQRPPSMTGEGFEDRSKQPHIDIKQLALLTASSMILTMLWETRSYLRRAWGLQALRSGKTKQPAKDMSKSPIRSANVSPDNFINSLASISVSLMDENSMLQQCQYFLNLHSIDQDPKENTDEEMTEEGQRMATPSDIGTEHSSRASAPPGSGRKKRASTSVTPSKTGKKRERPAGQGRRRSSKAMMRDEDDDDEGAGWD